jgi:hypothetical protein
MGIIQVSKDRMLRVLSEGIAHFRAELTVRPGDREAQNSVMKFESMRQKLLTLEDNAKCTYGESDDFKRGKIDEKG